MQMMLGFSGYLIFGPSLDLVDHSRLTSVGLIIGLSYDKILTITPL